MIYNFVKSRDYSLPTPFWSMPGWSEKSWRIIKRLLCICVLFYLKRNQKVWPEVEKTLRRVHRCERSAPASKSAETCWVQCCEWGASESGEAPGYPVLWSGCNGVWMKKREELCSKLTLRVKHHQKFSQNLDNGFSIIDKWQSDSWEDGRVLRICGGNLFEQNDNAAFFGDWFIHAIDQSLVWWLFRSIGEWNNLAARQQTYKDVTEKE